MSLQDTLDAFRANFETGGPPYNVPAWVHEPMQRATDELTAARASDRALKVGDKAPVFILENLDGEAVSSAELLKHDPLVVTFYRGAWCPYCNIDLLAIQAAQPSLEARGAKLVAISPQTARHSRRSQWEDRLSFPLLADPGNETAAAFGLRFTVPPYLRNLYKNTFRDDIATINGDANWTLPMPARFVIGQDGVILYAEVNPDYTCRPDPQDLVPVLDRIAMAA